MNIELLKFRCGDQVFFLQDNKIKKGWVVETKYIETIPCKDRIDTCCIYFINYVEPIYNAHAVVKHGDEQLFASKEELIKALQDQST